MNMDLSMKNSTKSIGFALSLLMLSLSPAYGNDNSEKTDKIYSPYVGESYPQDVYFGDTHLHTSMSLDAGLFGTVLGPEEAYQFASGQQVKTNTGQQAKLVRPLDFLVVADHAEYAGVSVMLKSGDPVLLADPVGARWHKMFNGTPKEGYDAFYEAVTSVTSNNNLIKSDGIAKSFWANNIAKAKQYNKPGKFTAFIGFEWGSMPGGNNLHRVVVFKDGADKTSQVLPYTSFESENPENLWKYMAAYEENTGGSVLAIPHNGNISNGFMFSAETLDGKPLNKAYAKSRAKWEPLYEATQMKGDSEAHPFLSPTDEFADFETWDNGNLDGSVLKQNEMLEGEYVREALKNGLLHNEKLGVNPFKFGMIGSTDSHSGMATTREDNNFSKSMHFEPGPERYKDIFIKSQKDPSKSYAGRHLAASGLAAVWATENTREALWDAMKRKEVYATTGNRLKVRVFGGWNFNESDLYRADFAKYGYHHGVPMGGDLVSAQKGKTPGFMIKAMRDVEGPNLDRVQVIKGWVDSKGKKQERIYDVALSDDRKIGKNGRSTKSVGSTVNIKDASYNNSIGEPMMEVFWSDPDFNAKQSAFYYVRVIEIPTPRWTAYDAKFYNVEMPEGTAMTVQDRAYTSPIWYTPKGKLK